MMHSSVNENHNPENNKPATSRESRQGVNRRKFLKSAATLGIAAAGVGVEPLIGAGKAEAYAPENNGANNGALTGEARAERSFQIRLQAARRERAVPIPHHRNNGDEDRFDNRIGNFTKTLPHNEFGEVDSSAYDTLLHAVNTGRPEDFDRIRVAGNTLLGNPQAGLGFDLEGTDSHQLSLPPAFPLDSKIRAGEMIELYWMALARDIPFTQYGREPITAAAIDELNRLSDYQGPKDNGQVTAQTLFRGTNFGETIGPLVSQFFAMPAPFGALAVNDLNGNPAQQYNVYVPGVDYMTDTDSFLAVQNGHGIADIAFYLQFGFPTVLGPRSLHTGRDLAAFVHIDELYQAYFMASLNLLDRINCPLNPGNPYVNSRTQFGFATFGNLSGVALLAEISIRALKAQWFQKWFVHRTLRPEAYGGLVNFMVNNHRDYPIHPELFNSKSLEMIASKFNGNLFLPMAFPEGCPPFPALGSGHSTVAGACATFIKAYFDENFVIPDPVVATDDGTALVPYTGPDRDKITVLTEAHKIASNVGIGRLHAGVHWRQDHAAALLLGEEIAISVLRDQRATFNENFGGYTFTKFDGTRITV